MQAVQSAISVLYRFKNSLYSAFAALSPQERRLQLKYRQFLKEYAPGSPEHNLLLAFEAFFDQGIYAKHAKYFQPIEKLRANMLRDCTIIKREDFGAGLSKNLYQRSKTTTVAKLCRGSSMPPKLARLLFEIVHHTNPQNILELGTCLGISGAYLSTAQQMSTKNGRFVTIEGDAATANIARKNFERLGLHHIDVENGRFADVLPKVLEKENKIHFALIDGHHNGPATLEYFNRIKHYLAEHAILVFDDIDWSAGMRLCWQSLSIYPELYICIDLGRTGICMYSAHNRSKKTLFLPL